VSDTTRRIDTRVDDVEWDDNMTLLFNGEPVTGEVVETTVDGFVLSSDEYADGVLNGRTRQWWAGGPLMSEGTARYGRMVGPYRQWRDDGTLELEKEFDSNGVLIAQRQFDEHGAQLS
jgi:antitoxin component YwqK of YwqJK toxin-antitoxin module